MKRAACVGLVGILFVWFPGPGLLGQDPSALRINEVIADNVTQGPPDIGGNLPDLLELYNSGDELIPLGTGDPRTSYALSDTLELPVDPVPLYVFRNGVEIRPEGFLTIFCDANAEENFCEPHASFRISSTGEEPITLWGPEEPDGSRPIIDQVWLPPLPENASFGRSPDGAGPAPVSIDEVLNTFVFFPEGSSTFGSCQSGSISPICPGGSTRVCRGEPNGNEGNLRPRVTLGRPSTNRPGGGEAVEIRVRVEDEDLPLVELVPGTDVSDIIDSVQLLYRVDGVEQGMIDLTYDETTGIQHDEIVERDAEGVEIARYPNPFKVWGEWTGTIPGQPAGSRVEFYLTCTDTKGAVDETPLNRCEAGVGPCDRQFGGPDCPRAGTAENPDVYSCNFEIPGPGPDDDPVVVVREFENVRYTACEAWFYYTVGYEPPPRLLPLVINEVVANQATLLQDPTEIGKDCRVGNPTCAYDDFIELYNGGDEAIDLSGLGLSNQRFDPRRWLFPAGATIDPGQYLIVWLDGDGGKCPCDRDPVAPEDAPYCEESADQPCFWECPDPNNVATQEFHASFTLDATSDQIYLLDTEEEGFGVIHAAEWIREDGLDEDHSLTLVPDGIREGCWVVAATHGPHPDDDHTHSVSPTAGTANEFVDGLCEIVASFIRGDANADCGVDITDGVFLLNFLFLGQAAPTCGDAGDSDDSGVMDITDAVFILNYLFLGGPPPPNPGPTGTLGPDPTPDALGECEYPAC